MGSILPPVNTKYDGTKLIPTNAGNNIGNASSTILGDGSGLSSLPSGGSLDLLASDTSSGVASVTFTGLAQKKMYLVRWFLVRASGSGSPVALNCRIGDGSVNSSSEYSYKNILASSVTTTDAADRVHIAQLSFNATPSEAGIILIGGGDVASTGNNNIPIASLTGGYSEDIHVGGGHGFATIDIVDQISLLFTGGTSPLADFDIRITAING